MARCELIKELALHVRAREAVQLLLDLAADQFAELIDAFEAHRLGEFIVGLRLTSRLDFLHGDVEGRRLTLELLDRIIFREGDVERPLIPGLGADQLILEARDETAGAGS